MDAPLDFSTGRTTTPIVRSPFGKRSRLTAESSTVPMSLGLTSTQILQLLEPGHPLLAATASSSSSSKDGHFPSFDFQQHRQPSSSRSSNGGGTPESLDPAHNDRRRKNNDSARRSREVRRNREIENRTRMQALEFENVQLRTQIAILRAELSQLHMILIAAGKKHVQMLSDKTKTEENAQ